MTEQEIRNRIRAFIADTYLYMRPNYVLRDADSLLANGIIDSLGVLELLEFADHDLNVKVADDEITEDNFGTVDSIVAFINSRLKDASVA